MNIRKFNENYSDFESAKKYLLKNLKDLIKEYEEFTNDVSPSHWRTTGHHLTELKRMEEQIQEMKEISEKEKDLDWVQQNRFK